MICSAPRRMLNLAQLRTHSGFTHVCQSSPTTKRHQPHFNTTSLHNHEKIYNSINSEYCELECKYLGHVNHLCCSISEQLGGTEKLRPWFGIWRRLCLHLQCVDQLCCWLQTFDGKLANEFLYEIPFLIRLLQSAESSNVKPKELCSAWSTVNLLPACCTYQCKNNVASWLVANVTELQPNG